MKKLWSGRFKEKTEKSVEDFTSSISYDVRLWKYDIEGSLAHVTMLAKQKVITAKDAKIIIKGLKEIRQEIEKGTFKFRDDLEDVHMNIEHALTKKIGPAGGKLHTGRSRNDQVALDVRMFLRHEIKMLIKGINTFQRILVSLAEKHVDVILPGYTHLQRAQPVLLSHHLLAYYEMMERDRQRYEDCLKRVNVMPLGSAALAGTTFPVDRKYVAKLLKFPALSENSIDAVSDRDFVAEFISASSIFMLHLSRLSEEFIMWNSDEFGFVHLPDAFTTGSSIMPQKKNPDIFELIRGKTGRVYGDLIAVLTLMKGLPLAYNRDMQEDKEPLFDTVDTVTACLEILCQMMKKVRFKREKMLDATKAGFLTATDIAEYLVKKGMPFREAHGVTGRVVSYCSERGKSLDELDLTELKKFSERFGKDIMNYISVQASVSGKQSYGSTSEKHVTARIKKLRNKK